MSRASAVRAVLTSEPMTTSELYRRVGYPTLARVGLVPYDAFRAELAKLGAAGVAASDTDRDGATVWWLAEAEAGA